jgi:hypothetical protein
MGNLLAGKVAIVTGAGQPQGRDHLGHEAFAQCLQLGRLGGGQGRQRKAQIGVDIQLAAPVVRVETLVGGPIHLGVHLAHSDQELAPGVVAVTGDQGVVEVEQGELHGILGRRGAARAWRCGRAAQTDSWRASIVGADGIEADRAGTAWPASQGASLACP